MNQYVTQLSPDFIQYFSPSLHHGGECPAEKKERKKKTSHSKVCIYFIFFQYGKVGSVKKEEREATASFPLGHQP